MLSCIGIERRMANVITLIKWIQDERRLTRQKAMLGADKRQSHPREALRVLTWMIWRVSYSRG